MQVSSLDILFKLRSSSCEPSKQMVSPCVSTKFFTQVQITHSQSMCSWVSTKFSSWTQVANGQSMCFRVLTNFSMWRQMVSPCVPGSLRSSPHGHSCSWTPWHVSADSRCLVHVLLGLYEVLLMDTIALLLSLLPQHLLRLHLLHHRAAHPEAHLKHKNSVKRINQMSCLKRSNLGTCLQLVPLLLISKSLQLSQFMR